MSKNIFSAVTLIFLLSAGGPFAIESKNGAVMPMDDPPAILQGGETFETATVIPSLPFSDGGTTIGYQADYNYTCYGPDNLGPDIVYSYTPTIDAEWVTISLCDSDFDTYLRIYRGQNTQLIYCNNDTCGNDELKSVILNAGMYASETYYIVIAGYEGLMGNYQMEVSAEPIPDCTAIPGDSNGNGVCNGLDVIYSINILLTWIPLPFGECFCPDSFFAGGDANGNCVFNGLDVTFTVNYLKGGPNEPRLCYYCP